MEEEIKEAYTEKEGKETYKKLVKLSKLPPDTFVDLTHQETKEIKIVETINDYLNTTFKDQEEKYQTTINDEVHNYESNFMEVSEKIKKEEDDLKTVISNFNECKDPNEKRKLFEDISKSMNVLLNKSVYLGSSLENTPTDDVIHALSAYDYGYDENTKRKIIKRL